MKLKKIVIYGSQGLAKEVHQVIEDIHEEKGEWEFLGFLDDEQKKFVEKVHGHKILGGEDWLKINPEVWVFIGIGNCSIRKAVCERLKSFGHNKFATLFHPRAWTGNRVLIGEGTVILAGAMISTDIKIGNQVVINKNSVIGHDASIKDFVTISPGVNVSGNVEIGEGSYIGSNATILQGLSIGEGSIIGAGAVVTKNLPKGTKAIGIPAKPIQD